MFYREISISKDLGINKHQPRQFSAAFSVRGGGGGII